ncbi:Chloride channel protein 2, partial [Symbiodinium microadriaticum]
MDQADTRVSLSSIPAPKRQRCEEQSTGFCLSSPTSTGLPESSGSQQNPGVLWLPIGKGFMTGGEINFPQNPSSAPRALEDLGAMDASLSLPLTREAAITNSHDWDAEYKRRNRCRKITYDFLHPRDQGIEKYYSRIFYYSSLALQWLLVSLVAINVAQAAVFLILLHWDVKLDDASQIVVGSDVVVVLTTVVFTLTFLTFGASTVGFQGGSTFWGRGVLRVRTRGRFLRRPLNALDLLSVILLWCIILQPLEHGYTQEGGAGGALSMAWRLGLKRILLALFVASGGVGQASYNQVLTPKAKADGRMVEEKILEYDFQADSWRPNRRQSHAGDSKRRSVFENLPQEDAFGFDPKSGGKFRLLLVMSAALSSMISFFVDRGAGVLQMLTNDVLDFFLHVFGGLGESSFVGFFILLLCNACLLWSAYALVRLSPEAAGSGLPEVKCILSGISLENFLKPRVLAAKSIGLMLVLGESLPVGK